MKNAPNFHITILKSAALVIALQLSACSKPDDSDSSVVSMSSDPQTQNKSIAPSSPASDKTYAKGAPPANQGTVISITQAGAYSYIETEIHDSLFWIAGPISTVKPNDKIVWRDYSIMNSFKSKALDRTFEQILFVDGVNLASAAPKSVENKGTVIEALNSAGYTYIQVKKNGKNLWLAAPTTNVNTGQTISWSGGAPMKNFTSRSLNRTFDTIFFIGAIKTHQG